jgi:hypothetical protein
MSVNSGGQAKRNESVTIPSPRGVDHASVQFVKPVVVDLSPLRGESLVRVPRCGPEPPWLWPGKLQAEGGEPYKALEIIGLIDRYHLPLLRLFGSPENFVTS